MPARLNPITEEEFVAAISDMTSAQRINFFLGYIAKNRIEVDRARGAIRLVERVFDEGKCPHCSMPLFGKGNDDIRPGPGEWRQNPR